MIIIYGGIAIAAAVVGTMALLELVTWYFDEDRRRFGRRRQKKLAKCKRKRPHTNGRSLDRTS